MYLFHHAYISYQFLIDLCTHGSVLVFVMIYLKLFGKVPLCIYLLKYLIVILINISEFLNKFCQYIIRLWSFLRVKAFDFFNCNRFCYSLETKIMLLYLIDIFCDRNTRKIFVVFDDWSKKINIEYSNFTHVKGVVPRFGMMLTNYSLRF